MKNAPLVFASLLGLLISTAIHAQQPVDRPAKDPCGSAVKVSDEEFNLTERKRIWTKAESNQDGLVSLTYCGVFANGATTVARLPVRVLSNVPDLFESYPNRVELLKNIRVKDLPLGFKLYRDMAYEIRTSAVPNVPVMTFKLPSILTEAEFKKLVVLYLDEDELLPGVLGWSEWSSDRYYQKSDFASRILVNDFQFTNAYRYRSSLARVVVGSFDQTELDEHLTNLYISSVVGPPYVKVDETFTYSITIRNGSDRAATEVAFNSSAGGAELVSVRSSLGKCLLGVNSSDLVACDLGTILPNSKVVIDITVQAEDTNLIDYFGEEVFTTLNRIDSREKDNSPDDNYLQSRSTIIRRPPK
jgi:hypothetical protein